MRPTGPQVGTHLLVTSAAALFNPLRFPEQTDYRDGLPCAAALQDVKQIWFTADNWDLLWLQVQMQLSK